MNVLRAPLCSLLVVGLACAAASARAEPRDPPGAEALFRDGRALAVAHRYAEACPKFEESLRLDPAPGTLLNLADCEEHTGKLALAWQHYVELAHELPPHDDRLPLAASRASRLEREVPRLSIRLAPWAPDGTRVTRDGLELGAASLGAALPVDPGEHVVVVRAPGHHDRTVRLAVAAGESRVVAAEPGDEISHGSSARHTAGWVTGGVGVASLATGAVFGVLALSRREQSDAGCTGTVCSNAAAVSAYDDARRFAIVSDVALGVGVAAVLAAGWLLLSGHSEETAPPRAAVVQGLSPRTPGSWLIAW